MFTEKERAYLKNNQVATRNQMTTLPGSDLQQLGSVQQRRKD